MTYPATRYLRRLTADHGWQGRLITDEHGDPQVAELLDTIGAAVRIAGRAPGEYPDDPDAQAAYTLGAWSNVEAAFRALLGGAR